MTTRFLKIPKRVPSCSRLGLAAEAGGVLRSSAPPARPHLSAGETIKQESAALQHVPSTTERGSFRPVDYSPRLVIELTPENSPIAYIVAATEQDEQRVRLSLSEDLARSVVDLIAQAAA